MGLFLATTSQYVKLTIDIAFSFHKRKTLT
jgi:hypothetical protein